MEIQAQGLADQTPEQLQQMVQSAATTTEILTFKDIWGETQEQPPSAYDRVNVRRLMLALRSEITRMFDYCATTPKDELVSDVLTRSSFHKHVSEYLTNLVHRRAINDFRVICDRSNNEEFSKTEFHADIYIKPTRSFDFIQLNFVAVRTGASFDEVAGKF